MALFQFLIITDRLTDRHVLKKKKNDKNMKKNKNEMDDELGSLEKAAIVRLYGYETLMNRERDSKWPRKSNLGRPRKIEPLCKRRKERDWKEDVRLDNVHA